MDNCGMQTNKKQESTETDIDRRGDIGREGREVGEGKYRVSKHVKKWGEKGGLEQKMTMRVKRG